MPTDILSTEEYRKYCEQKTPHTKDKYMSQNSGKNGSNYFILGKADKESLKSD
jgi:hypothetical protein